MVQVITCFSKDIKHDLQYTDAEIYEVRPMTIFQCVMTLISFCMT